MWLLIFIAVAVALTSGHGMGGWWWIFLLPLLFMASGNSRRAARRWDHRGKPWGDGWGDGWNGEVEKPKRDAEKPKHEPLGMSSDRYIRSDDGELLEVIEDEPPRRIRDEADDDTHYV